MKFFGNGETKFFGKTQPKGFKRKQFLESHFSFSSYFDYFSPLLFNNLGVNPLGKTLFCLGLLNKQS
jgi:hypothetical protein